MHSLTLTPSLPACGGDGFLWTTLLSLFSSRGTLAAEGASCEYVWGMKGGYTHCTDGLTHADIHTHTYLHAEQHAQHTSCTQANLLLFVLGH